MITKMINLCLQFFADAGTRINATVGRVNAYDGTTTAFTANNTESASDLRGELKDFYDTELLENTRVEMFYEQFAKKQALPAGHGGSIEWRKWNTFAPAVKLHEGVIPTGQRFGMSHKTAAVNQFGTYTSITDKLELRSYDDIIMGATEEMGASAAETMERLIRDSLLANTNVLYCDNITIATGAVESTPNKPNGSASGDVPMKDTSSIKCYLTPVMVAKAVTKLKKDRVPTIGGKYVAVIHPSVAHDLRQDANWIDMHKYSAVTELFNGEIGELHGCRFIENTFSPVLSGDTYKNAANGCTYATYFFGKDAFGIINPEGGNLQMIVHDKDEIGGPLNQFSTIGYKMEFGSVVLYPERVLRVMSCSSYSAVDVTNYAEITYET